jgi:YidC/Oxa1 family membrane protein insertase
VLAKLITTPLSAAQFRSMQAMQRVQPELKKLQEKYKDDRQQMAKAQMELFKEHKVNPLSSCLPMLIQMPILIWVYYGIRYFVYRFEGVQFLYIQSLGDPDVIAIGARLWPGPLLLLYGVSMYFSQRLIATPAATPEQQQQQKLMAYMMPVLLVVILKDLPAAFILYWFLQNILMTAHQYFIMRAGRAHLPAADASGGGSPEPPAPRTGPPQEAIDRLSQGSRRRKKKRKRK